MKTFAHENNQHVAAKVQTILTNAELAFLQHGIPHAEFYRRERNLHKGLTRRILDRLTELGNDTSIKFSDQYFKDLGL